jgi:hypothetical protein
MDRRSILTLLAAATVRYIPVPLASAQCDDDVSQSNDLRVSKVLERMQSIEPGMTRKRLLSVFTPEGGLSEVMKRTYRSRDCLYFAVDVEYQSGSRSGNRNEPTTSIENPQDRILTISPPYLKLSFVAD